MKKEIPSEEIFWTLEQSCPPLTESIETDVVIIGAGIAGLSAAQSFAERGHNVVVLEKFHCAAGASGKSSGFVTANAELGLTHFVTHYGLEQAHKIWELVNAGVNSIQHTIQTHNIVCDYRNEDALILANSNAGLKDLTKEYNNYQKLGYESSLYTKHTVQDHVNSTAYYGGMRFGNSFGINAHDYSKALKNILIQKGVTFYENTAAISLEPHRVITPHGTVTAKHIIVCTDRAIPQLHKLTNDIFQVQTFIMMSNPLSAETIARIVPNKHYLMWDTDLVYQYFRITGDNRLLIGGSSMLHSYVYKQEHNPKSVYNKLSRYIQTKFPEVDINFEYMWPGLIGVSKDLMPLIGPDSAMPSVYYVGAVTGLAWGTTLGEYAAQHILEGRNDFDAFFSPHRKFLIGGFAQKILGQRATFGLSNLISLLR